MSILTLIREALNLSTAEEAELRAELAKEGATPPVADLPKPSPVVRLLVPKLRRGGKRGAWTGSKQ
jgi:hypothetical protein